MRILVEASAACDQRAGIGRYSRALIERVVPMRPEDRWRLFRAPASSAPSLLDHQRLGATSRMVTVPFSRRRADQLWLRARAPVDIRLLAGRVDLVYSPDFTAPPAFGVPRIVTVHDLAFMTHPSFSTPALNRFLNAVVPWQVRMADRIVVVSDATRQDLQDLLGVDADRIDLVRNGVDERFFVTDEVDDGFRERLDLPPRYMLMVGTIEPRKNHLGVFRAIERSAAARDVPLVVAGAVGWGADEILAEAARLESHGRVRRIGHFNDDDLPRLYAGAEVVLYPSWTEGFGLPILEAFAAGRPVITGTSPALRETASDLATFVDPADDVAIARAIDDALQSPDDDDAAMERRSHARAFSWDASAAALSAVFDRYAVGGK